MDGCRSYLCRSSPPCSPDELSFLVCVQEDRRKGYLRRRCGGGGRPECDDRPRGPLSRVRRGRVLRVSRSPRGRQCLGLSVSVASGPCTSRSTVVTNGVGRSGAVARVTTHLLDTSFVSFFGTQVPHTLHRLQVFQRDSRFQSHPSPDRNLTDS